jgi:hypothetical protein
MRGLDQGPIGGCGTVPYHPGMDTSKCETCRKDLAAGVERFCGPECRLRFTEGLRKGTPSHPGRRAAWRLRRRGG